jgi:hypothetical protein
MFGLENYQPDIFTGIGSLMSEYGHALKNLTGRKIKSVWVAWDCLNDCWYSDFPIVMDIEGQRIELCHRKLDQLAVSMNTIILSQRICLDHNKVIREWRKDALPEFIAIKGNRIRGIELIEHRIRVNADCHKGDAGQLGEYTAWVPGGIGFELDDGYISICNGLDKNQINIRRNSGEDIRIYKVME